MSVIRIITYRDDDGVMCFARSIHATRDEIERALKLQEERLMVCKERIAELIRLMEERI